MRWTRSCTISTVPPPSLARGDQVGRQSPLRLTLQFDVGMAAQQKRRKQRKQESRPHRCGCASRCIVSAVRTQRAERRPAPLAWPATRRRLALRTGSRMQGARVRCTQGTGHASPWGSPRADGTRPGCGAPLRRAPGDLRHDD
jgi:hypothetical protein